jgi:hypothetical protein
VSKTIPATSKHPKNKQKHAKKQQNREPKKPQKQPLYQKPIQNTNIQHTNTPLAT